MFKDTKQKALAVCESLAHAGDKGQENAPSAFNYHNAKQLKMTLKLDKFRQRGVEKVFFLFASFVVIFRNYTLTSCDMDVTHIYKG